MYSQQLHEIIELLRPISAWFEAHPLRPQGQEVSYGARPSKKEADKAFQEMVGEHLELRAYARTLQRQFHLLQPPHKSRVRRYLQTHDPSVFDGLRRTPN